MQRCASYSTGQQKETLISNDVPDRPRAKNCSDLFDLEHKCYMLTIDYYSGIFEIDEVVGPERFHCHQKAEEATNVTIWDSR